MMKIVMTATAMKIDAFAKVNFTLDVIGKRADGFHALRSLVVPVSLCDTIEIELATNTIASNTGFENDLSVAAARALRDATTRDENLGAIINVTKRIPTGGGLGGGSADAAATLVALNNLWQCNLSPRELATIGAKVGSDIPALVMAHYFGPILMEGRGEIVSPIFETRDAIYPELAIVVANPGVFCSTPEVFREFRLREKKGFTDEMISAFRDRDILAISRALSNDLEDVAIRLHPEIATLKSRLNREGARGVLMSGSGSSVFAIVDDIASAEQIATNLTRDNIHAHACKIVHAIR